MLRTHVNNELTVDDLDKEVSLSGWVATTRDHGGVIFIDLRDRWGVTQVVFNPEKDKALHEEAKKLRTEFCIGIKGIVTKRPEGTVNAKLPTGEIEIDVQEMTCYSQSQTPPFEIDTTENLSEEIRLKHRYLDLRRDSMQKNLLFRNKLIHEMRCFLHSREFVEIDTPILTKSTPEGARDYLVPSRVHQGSFFALPQSPQLFKQILMVSGFDRYFQVAKCFRDEDLRADRQPEFTQLDLEMAFVTEEDVFNTIEDLIRDFYKGVLNKELESPFLRLSYHDAMSRFGSDKPDLRFGLEIRDVSHVFENTTLKIFKQTIENKGVILALQLPQPEKAFSRKDFDDLIEFAKECGAGGLAYLKVTEDGFESPIAKFFNDDERKSLLESLPEESKAGDIIFFAADKKKVAQHVLGQVRLQLGQKLNLIKKDEFSWCWVHEFPLFQYNEEDKRWESEHHPFTSPHSEDIPKLDSDPGNIRSSSYDLVLNGNEIASGSIRIHDSNVQRKIFEVIGIDKEEVESRFGFLLRAFQYGPPPHGGIALGLDRLATIFLGLDSIRDVIAFPKTQRAICQMTEAPSEVGTQQLRELGIRSL